MSVYHTQVFVLITHSHENHKRVNNSCSIDINFIYQLTNKNMFMKAFSQQHTCTIHIFLMNPNLSEKHYSIYSE